jgi:hypothetical protein
MSLRRFVSILGCLTLWLLAGVAHAKRVIYAIAIGNNQPPPDDAALAPLQFADDDAVRYFDLFRRAGEHVALLTILDKQTRRRYPELATEARTPSLAELFRTFDSFRTAMAEDRKRGDEPVFFLAFSGHGSRNEQGYFLSFLDGGLTQDLLYERVLATLPDTEVHLIVDACNAAGVLGIRGPFDHERDAQIVRLDADTEATLLRMHSLARFPLVGALVATSVGQEAHEWSRIESGVFTHEVVSALLGAADINSDLRIEYSEVEAYVASANRGISDPRAVPDIMARAPAARPHAPLIELMNLKQSLILTANGNDLGRFSIDLPNGARLLEGHTAGNRRVVLALPAVPGIFLRQNEAEAEVPARPVVHFRELTFTEARFAARGPLDRTLRDQLFSNPFTTDYYRGFVDSQESPSVDFTRSPPALPGDAEPSTGDQHGPATPRWVPMALAITAGVAFAAAAVSTGLAADTRRSFDESQLQRHAVELRDRYQVYTTVAGVSGAVSAIAGVGAFITWPRGEFQPMRAGVVVEHAF